MAAKKHHAELERGRDGSWRVKISLTDGHRYWAWPGTGRGQKVIYDHPHHIPTHLKKFIVPPLIDEARNRNMRGE